MLSFLILQPAVFLTAWVLQYAAPIRRPLFYSLLSTVVMDALWLLNNVVLDAPTVAINALGYPICYFILPLIFGMPSGRVRAIAAQMLLATLPLLLCMLMDTLLHCLAEPLGLQLAEFYDPESLSYAAVSLVLNGVSCLVMFGGAKILGRILSPLQESRSLLWFLTIPTSQLILIAMLVNLYFYRGEPVSASALTGLGVLLCVGSDLACISGFRKYQKMQQAGQKLEEVRHQLVLQTEHYRDLQSDILKINEIRHDLKNQLHAALYLMDQGNYQEADSQLEHLDRELSKKVGSQYCENLMIDAVLSEKAETCREKRISLLASVPVPQQLNIENACLCSAFSNLLDNAIEGTLQSASPEGPIDLSCDIRGSYLIISCKNPGNKPAAKGNAQLLRTHGLGLDILQRIAETCGGSFQTHWENGIFYANLILKV